MADRQETLSKRGRRSLRRGKDGEREVAEILRKRGFSDARRGRQYSGSPDSPDVVGLPGYHIECKRTEALQLYKAFEQAQRDAGDDVPVVVHRRNGKPWLAILGLGEFLGLVKEAK